jgi:acyl carrier protein
MKYDDVIISVLSEYSGIQSKKISKQTRLDMDLGLNSMDFAIIVSELEDRLKINLNSFSQKNTYNSVYTVSQIIDIVERCKSE